MAESFRFRYDSAMMSVQEYAQEAKVSERSVRARLERGMLQGRKLGSRWVVDSLPAAHRSNAGRPISFDAFNTLARYFMGRRLFYLLRNAAGQKNVPQQFRCKGQRLLSDTEPAVG